MNDVEFSLGTLESIYEEARRDDMTFAERAGLYAAAVILCDQFHAYVDEHREGYPYAHEKVTQFQWHIGAAVGFEITNGLPKEQHTSSALGALWSLRDVLTQGQAA